MKKLLILIAAIALVSCGKDEDLTLSRAEQEIENAKLVGTWQATEENSLNRTLHYVFTEDFKMSTYSTFSAFGGGIAREDGYTNEPYTIPQKGKIALTRLQNNYRLYWLSGQFIFITDAWESKFKKIE